MVEVVPKLTFFFLPGFRSSYDCCSLALRSPGLMFSCSLCRGLWPVALFREPLLPFYGTPPNLYVKMQPSEHSKQQTSLVLLPAVHFEEKEPQEMARGMDILVVGASGFTG